MTGRTPRRSLRLRLTATYGLLFLGGGTALIAITYLLTKHATGLLVVGDDPSVDPTSTTPRLGVDGTPSAQSTAIDSLRTSIEQQRNSDLDQLLIWSSVALLITAAVAVLAGWFVTGRALRPLRTMTGDARHISQHTLHARLDSAGPQDEVRDLADTINDLLARLEAAFEAQRRFVANASHELRTPLTWERTLIEVTLADPKADLATLRSTYDELLVSVEDKERLIDALLTLATSERGLSTNDGFDLGDTVAEALSRVEVEAKHPDVTIESRIEAAPIVGNRDLIRRLIDNLLDNAVRHNTTGGRVELSTENSTDGAVLTVSNTGPDLAPDDLERIIEPFERLEAARSSHRHGHGLGLSIVNAIATAHGGRLTLRPRPGGGLIATVVLPATRRMST